jgi:hypothetical protein
LRRCRQGGADGARSRCDLQNPVAGTKRNVPDEPPSDRSGRVVVFHLFRSVHWGQSSAFNEGIENLLDLKIRPAVPRLLRHSRGCQRCSCSGLRVSARIVSKLLRKSLLHISCEPSILKPFGRIANEPAANGPAVDLAADRDVGRNRGVGLSQLRTPFVRFGAPGGKPDERGAQRVRFRYPRRPRFRKSGWLATSRCLS